MRLFDTETDGGLGVRGQRWARLAFLWGVWALVGLFFSSQLYFYFYGTAKQISFPRALAWQMSAVVISALSTPLVLGLARRYRVERQTWHRTLPLHLLAGVVLSTAWSAYHIVLDSTFAGNFTSFKWANLPRLIFVNIDREMLVYAIIVVVSHAASYYQRYREGELRGPG